MQLFELTHHTSCEGCGATPHAAAFCKSFQLTRPAKDATGDFSNTVAVVMFQLTCPAKDATQFQ